MTEARIYSLAYDQALMVWERWYEKLKAHPDNKIFHQREKIARSEMEEIIAIMEKKGLI